AAVPAGVTTDFTGTARFVDIAVKTDTGSGTVPIVDIGPYEAALLVYVDASAIGANNGSNWTNAYTNLAFVVQVSYSGQTIRVADGTYKTTATADRTISFQLKSGVAINGGYAGFGAPNPDALDFVNTPSILSGD